MLKHSDKTQIEKRKKTYSTSQEHFPQGLKIIIPLFKNPHLLTSLSEGLLACAAEIREANGTIMLINDSPDDLSLSIAIQTTAEILFNHNLIVEIKKNERNLGFIKSANKGLMSAVEGFCNALLLNSDAVLKNGCIREMLNVANIDHMIGFVSPRSNNATICSLPHLTDGQDHSEDTYKKFKAISQWLPRFTYTPTAVGFCLFIKYKILCEFGFLDEIYDLGYNEENDLIMRANRAGYRCVIANRAYAFHYGSGSFGLEKMDFLHRKNESILNMRYPEYLPGIKSYMESSSFLTEELFSSFVPDIDGKISLGIDFSHLGSFFNGTFEMGVNILKKLAYKNNPFSIYLIASHEAAKFHKIDEIEGVKVVPPDTNMKFAIMLRMGQPQKWEEVHRMTKLGALNVYFMLDTILWDCAYLSVGTEIDSVWRFALEYSDGIIFNSRFTMHQFELRIPIPKTISKLVSLHSTHPYDYIQPEKFLSSEKKTYFYYWKSLSP